MVHGVGCSMEPIGQCGVQKARLVVGLLLDVMLSCLAGAQEPNS